MILHRKKSSKKNKQQPNKKVKNATITYIDGIEFKSKIEAYCYNKLKENNIKAFHEKFKFVLLDKFKFNGVSYRITTYTPDFVGKYFIIETKGFPNETFPIKWKLFLNSLLEMNLSKYNVYLVHNEKEIDSCIKDIINNNKYENNCS